jgi:predicted metal-dependent enzyme (double-stranded beta helix superfamily)
MNADRGIPQDLLMRCLRWSGGIGPITDSARRIEYFQSELPDLLGDRELFRRILSGITVNDAYPDLGEPTMFGNEIILFRDPARQFSVRIYLWRQNDFDPIHDHNSWGVIGVVAGSIEVTHYQGLDGGWDGGQADLKVGTGRTVPACGTWPVLMLNKGIHRTGNADNPFTVVQVNVYGRNLTGRKYVNAFDAGTGIVSRLTSPRRNKRELAGEALQGLYP